MKARIFFLACAINIHLEMYFVEIDHFRIENSPP